MKSESRRRSKLSILICGINYAPESSGIAPYTTGLACGLRERGHDVTVITTYPHYPRWLRTEGYGGWSRVESLNDVTVRRVWHYIPTKPTGLCRALSELSFGARLIFSRFGRPDVVLCVSPALMSSVMTTMRVRWRMRDLAVGLIMQDLYSVGIRETRSGGAISHRLMEALESWAVRRVDGVVVIHDRFRMRVIGALRAAPSKVTVIRNWTHLRRARWMDRDDVRRRLGWDEDIVVLHAGAMGEKQSLSNVVEAARESDRRHAGVRFVLVGDGGQRASLVRQAAGVRSIEFRTPLPDELYGQAMCAADILLVNEMPGVADMAVPSKLTSYFTTGVPVLAATESRSTTAVEIAASGAGVRTDPGNPSMLVDAVLELVADRELASQIGARGPTYCEKVLNQDVAIDAYEDWINQLVERAKTRRRKR